MTGSSLVITVYEDYEFSSVTVPIQRLGASVVVSREADSYGASQRAIDGLREWLGRWERQGWTFHTEPTLHAEDDPVRNAVRYSITVEAFLGPNALTEVDHQVERDCGPDWRTR